MCGSLSGRTQALERMRNESKAQKKDGCSVMHGQVFTSDEKWEVGSDGAWTLDNRAENVERSRLLGVTSVAES
jgi:hypothetical protein